MSRSALHLALAAAVLTLCPPAYGQATFGLDLNSNQLSDLYEQQFAGPLNPADDNDQDGQTNAQESASATDPFDGRSRLDFATLSISATDVSTQWQSVRGKRYQLQIAETLAGPWTDDGAPLMGTGGLMTLPSTIQGERLFIRMNVKDVDSDGDGASDWEEYQGGTDPLNSDTDGDGITDFDALSRRLGLANRVNIVATDSVGAEGGNGLAFKVTRTGNFNPISVPISYSGTATSGTDYAVGPATVFLGLGVGSTTVNINILSDAEVDSGETVILTLGSGAGFTVGALSSATGVITEQGTGTGLSAKYFDDPATATNAYNASEPYTTGDHFNPANLFATRVDPIINFTSETVGNPWRVNGFLFRTAAGVDLDHHSVQWTGQVEPQFSEDYTFYAMGNTGARLFVNGTAIAPQTGISLIQAWNGRSGTETPYAPIPLEAGRRYDIKLEWHDETGSSAATMSWQSPSTPKALIPTNRLYPTGYPSPAGPPVITSPSFAVAFTGGPFSYQIAATNAPTSYGADGLPDGLTLNPSTGQITGSATGSTGLEFSTISASNAIGSASTTLTILVINAGGGLTRDVWAGVSGSGVSSVPIYTAPTTSTTVTSFQAPSNSGDDYGERIRGWITAPVSGNYTFFLTTADENAELWVSADGDYSRVLKRSYVNNVAPAGTWNAAPSQKSMAMKLQAGKRYYVEARRKEASGNDQLSVGWLKPGQVGTEPSEVIPGYVCSPHAIIPGGGSEADTVYVTNLTPQAGVISNGSGIAILRVNAAKTDAYLQFFYGGLTGPVSAGQHIHDSRSFPGPSTTIVFDIDTAPPDADGVHHWHLAPTGNHTVQDLIDAIETGAAYINLHTQLYQNGEIKGFFQPAGGVRTFVPPPAPPAESNPTMSDAEAARFLMQASMGPRPDTNGTAPWDVDSIERVKEIGYAAWIDEQLAISPGTNPETLVLQELPNPDPPDELQVNIPTYNYTPFRTVRNGSGPLATFIKEQYGMFPRLNGDGQDQSAGELWRAWWKVSLSHPDQLRQRVAWALSQILVVSEAGPLDENARAVAHYYDMLQYHGLGNFRELLERVTLNVGMGRYLDMLRNRKPDGLGRTPNENYAREIKQLFSIGLKRLNPDGSTALDASNLPVPTYGQNEVVGLSHVFTGWSYTGDTVNSTSFTGGSTNYIQPMIPFPTLHDGGEKVLLDNTIVPASTPTTQTVTDELEAALDMLFHHPNTGPFICRQLIQRMVTANPSPGYIYRVAKVFEDDGTGVRGNMAAVVKTLLLDPEARTMSARNQIGYGHLKEPVLRISQLFRALRGFSAAALQPFANQLPHAEAATTANIDLSVALPVDANNLTFLDGQRLWPNQRVLVKDQTNAAENGLYVFTASGATLTRHPAADSPAELTGAYVRISYGATDGVTYRQTATITTVGTDLVTWVNNNGGNPYGGRWNMTSTGGSSLGQTPLQSPTVFNYYEPDYTFPGATGDARLYGPEFQILSETSVVNTANTYYNFVSLDSTSGSRGLGTNSDLKLEYYNRPTYATPYPWPLINAADPGNNMNNPEYALAYNVPALLDRLNNLLLGGRMSTNLRSTITTRLNGMTQRVAGVGGATAANELADRRSRVADAVYLVSISHEYSVQK